MNKYDFNTPTTNTATGVLAKLWRTFIKDNSLIGFMPMLIDRYLTKNKDSDIGPIKKKNKATMENNVSAREMSIKTFVDLMFNLVNCKEMDITIKVTLPNNKKTEHTVKLSKDDINTIDKELLDAINAAERAVGYTSGSKKHANKRTNTGDTIGQT